MLLISNLHVMGKIKVIPDSELTADPETWARIRWVGHGAAIWQTSPLTRQALIYHVRKGHLRVLEVADRRYYDVAAMHELLLRARPRGGAESNLPKYKVLSLPNTEAVPKVLRRRMEGEGQVVRRPMAPKLPAPSKPRRQLPAPKAPPAPIAPPRAPLASPVRIPYVPRDPRIPVDPRAPVAPPRRVPFFAQAKP